MKSSILPQLIFTYIFLFSFSSQSLTFSPKLIMRSGALFLQNTQTGGSTPVIGGLGLTGQHYLSPKFSLGLSYRVEFDYFSSIAPLKGIDFHSRYYFYGIGTRVTTESSLVNRVYRSNWGIYLLGELSHRNYNLIDTSIANQLNFLSGSMTTFNAGLGADYSLSRQLEINLEFNMSLMGFSSDPTKVKLKHFGLLAGVGYVF